MKVNGLPFLVTYGQVVKFGTTTKLLNTKFPCIITAMTLVLRAYGSRGFRVNFIAADNVFAPLQQNEEFLALGVIVNIKSKGEHEPFSEIFIRTIKER